MKLFLSLLLVLVIAIAGCSQASQEPTAPSSAMPVPGSEGVQEQVVAPEEPAVSGNDAPAQESDGINGNAVAAESDRAAGEVMEFTMTAQKFSFDPATITVNEGDTVRLIVTSMDVSNGFAIPEFGFNSGTIEPGETKTVEFVASKKGTYTFFCSVFCGTGHKSMKGTLIVK